MNGEFKPITEEIADLTRRVKTLADRGLDPRPGIELLHIPYDDVLIEPEKTGWKTKYLRGGKPYIIEEFDLTDYVENDTGYLVRGLLKTEYRVPLEIDSHISLPIIGADMKSMIMTVSHERIKEAQRETIMDRLERERGKERKNDA